MSANALLEAPVSIRRRLGRDQLAHDPESIYAFPDSRCSTEERVEIQKLLRELGDLIVGRLTRHQRTVLIAIAIDGVSPSTLAIELETTPGALYKTLHDARRKLTTQLTWSDANRPRQARNRDQPSQSASSRQGAGKRLSYRRHVLSEEHWVVGGGLRHARP